MSNRSVETLSPDEKKALDSFRQKKAAEEQKAREQAEKLAREKAAREQTYTENLSYEEKQVLEKYRSKNPPKIQEQVSKDEQAYLNSLRDKKAAAAKQRAAAQSQASSDASSSSGAASEDTHTETSSAASSQASYPIASAVAGRTGIVISPHTNQPVDVSDFKSGTLVKDPTSSSVAKFFRVP